MVHKTDLLVIIGISVGVALGILIASLIFFGIRWYRKRAHLRRCANERSFTTLPIQANGLGTSTDYSASLSTSKGIQVSENLQKNSPRSWWNHQNKDRFFSAPGVLRYSYKYVEPSAL